MSGVPERRIKEEDKIKRWKHMKNEEQPLPLHIATRQKRALCSDAAFLYCVSMFVL